MICDKCKKQYDEPSSNQHIDIEINFITPDGRESYQLCSKCKNELYDWLFKEKNDGKENE